MPADLISLTAAAESEAQFIINSARIRAATLVLIPAFEESYITLTGEPDEDGLVPWESVIAVEDTPTGDGRQLAGGSLRWDTLPMPLPWARKNNGGHDGAEPLGRIDVIERDGKLIKATGVIYTMMPEGALAAELIKHQMVGGISVDLDDIPSDAVEIVRSEAEEAEDELYEVVSSVVGDTGLSIWDDRERDWSGSEARSRVLEWATSDSGKVSAQKLAQAFLWRDNDGNPEAVGSYKLGFVDIINGRPYIVARGVFATAGGRGIDEADIPSDAKSKVRSKINSLYEKLAKKFKDPSISPPWERENSLLTDEELGLKSDPAFKEVTASAWSEFQKIDVYPTEWFTEPAREELPTDKGGVFAKDGHIWGWVAQKGIVHDQYRNKNLTLADLSPMDMTTFLRTKVQLSNGDQARVGVITMNAGHHRDGAECETDACLFDDTKTVAGIVTVGMNKKGLWFSGAAAPWLSDWDWSVFQACQPSLHVVWDKGTYSLRAVLTVPSPGFPSRLTASAVVDRSNIALLSQPPEEESEDVVEFTGKEGNFQVSINYEKLASKLDINYEELADKIAEAIDRRDKFKAEAETLKSELDDMFNEMVDEMKVDVNGGNE